MFKNCWMNSGLESTLGVLIRSSACALASSCACCDISGGAPLIERRCWRGDGGGGEDCCGWGCNGGVGSGFAGVAPIRVSNKVSFDAWALGDRIGDPRWLIRGEAARWFMRGEVTLFWGGEALPCWGLLTLEPCNRAKSGFADGLLDPFTTVTGGSGDCCCWTLVCDGGEKVCGGAGWLCPGECIFNVAVGDCIDGWERFGCARFKRSSNVFEGLGGCTCCCSTITTGSLTGLPCNWFNSANDGFDGCLSFWTGDRFGWCMALLNRSLSDKAWSGWEWGTCWDTTGAFCGGFAAWNNAARSTDLPTGGELTGRCSAIVALPNSWSSETLVPKVVWVVFCTVVNPDPKSVLTSMLVVAFEASLILVPVKLVLLFRAGWKNGSNVAIILLTISSLCLSFLDHQSHTAKDSICPLKKWVSRLLRNVHNISGYRAALTRWCLVYDVLIL